MANGPVRIGITTAPGTSPDGPIVAGERAYADAVRRVGGVPLFLPVLGPAHVGRILGAVDGLVITGGGDVDPARYGQRADPSVGGVDPERDDWEIALVLAATIPVLGVCRGAQVLNVAAGGTLVQDLPLRSIEHRAGATPDEEVHVVDLAPGSRLAAILGVERIRVNTLHHQSVDRIGTGLVECGRADDGVIEAVESVDAPVLGVQWHPELLMAQGLHRRLFAWLVDAAGRGADGSPEG